MILPNVVHSFYLGKDSDCEFQQIHFRPETFANVILDNSGIYPISMMHAIHFHFKTYYHQKSDSVLDDCLQKVIDLHASSNSLFSAANINLALMNIMLHILDKKQPDEVYLNQLTDLLGIRERLTHLPHELSGGQQQRVAIARALIAKPDIIFADEPTGNLDSKSGGEVMEMLQSIWKKMGKTLVIITHDSRIARMADRQFVIVDGVLSEVTAR